MKPSGSTEPFRPVRIAVVGLNFGRMMVRDLIGTPAYGIQVVTVCDRDRAMVDRIAGEFGVRACYDLDAVLADPSIEAVGLFTGPHGRAALLSKIIRTGRDVITTKPFEMNVADARSVLAEAEKLGRVIHLNSPTPCLTSDVIRIREFVDKFDLGRPLALRAETWAGYHEQANGSWYDDPVLCPAAPLLRLGIYFFNDFCPLIGDPASLHVMATRLRTGRPTPDHAHVGIRFHNGALAQVFASFCVDDGRSWQDRVSLVYERGTIVRWIERPVAHMHAEAYAVVECFAAGMDKPVRVELPRGDYAGQYQWANFARTVRRLPVIGLEAPANAVYGVRLLEAIGRSCAAGAEVPVLAEPRNGIALDLREPQGGEVRVKCL